MSIFSKFNKKSKRETNILINDKKDITTKVDIDNKTDISFKDVNKIDSENMEFDDLININDKWCRGDVIRDILRNPNQANLRKIELAIDKLVGRTCEPYKKNIEDMDQNAAVQGLIYYANNGVFISDPYGAQALIPLAGQQIEFVDRQVRSVGDNLSAAILDLLVAQLQMSKMV